MKYQQLGNSDLHISAITFGAWAIGGWMWGGADATEAIEAIRTAISAGATTIDTAPVYGMGISEKLVGEAINVQRDKVQILTKFGLRWDAQQGEFYFNTVDDSGQPIAVYKNGRRSSIIAECEASLRRLQTDYIDLYQMHWPDNSVPLDEPLEALDRLRDAGKIRYGAVCNYSTQQLSDSLKTFPLLSNQVHYSMVQRGIEAELVPFCIEHKVGILAYSPLQRGILTGKMTKNYKFAGGDGRPSTPYYREPNYSNILALIDRLRPLALAHNISMAQLVLNWTLNRPGITAVLAGARNARQVIDNIEAANITLSADVLQQITEEVERVKIV